MAYTILSESYGRRLPKITAEADSTDDLAILGIDYAEGSTCTVGGTEYTLDKVSGWIIPGSGGGGGGDDIFFVDIWWELDGYECSKTFEEIVSAFNDGKTVLFILDHATPQSMIAFEMDSYSVTDVKVWFFGASRETEDKFNFYTITMDSEGISDTYKSYTLSPDDA